mmetsp:Transcript_29646/g.49155  ORF Transcript_29646/g.49155 Transcript_29646/m.49155 type:complete len:283 (+) Transcript_29646:27-875(+)|eukprot:CAMPEP_0178740462 /NCGR_PEP_ID=MMETSP0744-20121128/4603_1 /TAXON_ID=913974 /ORGANISM="Nitzschia punctata, Strain CCMP561" /LENGTH=282 /DNA_ID=CAMNT_0020393237 /DNA_START=27 /DNA_END=875 /DNA_ORIENTATION=-
MSQQQQQHQRQQDTPLGIIFDIDGTLIAEGSVDGNIKIRPGVIQTLTELKARGHRLALWTAAHSTWADRVCKTLCVLVSPDHDDDKNCSNQCRKTFDFCWSKEKLIAQQGEQGALAEGGDGPQWNRCRWCKWYSSQCNRCACWTYAYACPCRHVKDLNKVWSSRAYETSGFSKERTIIVENTPQQCICNYGNAVYVPTYKGYNDKDDRIFVDSFLFFVKNKLEPTANVRSLHKCFHKKRGPHACFEQIWWCWTFGDKEQKGLIPLEEQQKDNHSPEVDVSLV